MTGGDVAATLRRQIRPAAAGAILGGGILIVARAFTPPELAEADKQFQPPFLVRILYGSITEEILLRWGLMTSLLWGGWRLFQSKARSPHPALAWTAILLSALLFGAGHLPTAIRLVGELTVEMLAYVLAGNTVFGIVAGYLYWRWGLETAILAHAGAHVVVFVGAILPVPF